MMFMLKENLKRYRIKNNMSQEELASKVCVSRSSIALYEKGLRNPNNETIKLICRALNINVEDLTDKRNIYKSIVNLILCILGITCLVFTLYYLIYDLIIEYYFYDNIIFEKYTNKTILLLTYICSFIAGLIMNYLIFTNLKKSKKKLIITITTLPIFSLFIIYSINQNTNLFKNVSDEIINWICIPLLFIYYIFASCFIVKNLLLETRYIIERVNVKTINILNIVISFLFMVIVLSSIIYLYTANANAYVIETIFYEYGEHTIVKSSKLVPMLSLIYTKKFFSLLFVCFQISIFSISLVNVCIKNVKTGKLLIMINCLLTIIFIFLWTMYPNIFGEVIDEIKFIPCGFDC